MTNLAKYKFSIKYQNGKKHGRRFFFSRNSKHELKILLTWIIKQFQIKKINVLLSCANTAKNTSNIDTDILELTTKEILRKINLTQPSINQSEDETILPVYKAATLSFQLSKQQRGSLSHKSKLLMKKSRKQVILPEKYH